MYINILYMFLILYILAVPETNISNITNIC